MDSKKSGETSNNFECTICLDAAKEPVLTRCGHMFCWPCIYNWLDSKGGKAKCPNCKNEITKDDLIPVYANNENKENTNRFKNIPKRPKAERNPNSDRDENNQNFFNFGFSSFGLGGFFPFMGMGMNFNNNNQYENEYNNDNNNQRQSEFLQGVPENTKQAIINLMFLMLFVFFFLQFY